MNITKWLLIMLFSITVAACDGGDGGTDPNKPESGTLSGVAAVGDPIANGTIQIICAGGTALNTSTDSNGVWQVTISGQTPPCVVEVSGGTVNGVSNSNPYHSISTSLGIVNVTPLTDLLLANLQGTATPDLWFAGLDPSTLTLVTPGLVNASRNKQCAALSGLTSLCTINPITAAFTPNNSNTLYKLLIALQQALGNSGVSYTSLLGNASNTDYTAPVSGFNTALTDAYTAIDTSTGFTGNFLGWTGSSDAAHSFVLVRANGRTGAITTIGGTGFYPGLAYGPDGRLYGVSTSLQIINPTDGTTVKIGDLQYQGVAILMNNATFSPDGVLYVIENGSPRRIFTVDLSNAALTYVGTPTETIRSLEFASNGTLYASFANLFTLNAADASTLSTVGGFGSGVYLDNLTFGSGGTLFSTHSSNSDYLYSVNLATGMASAVTALASNGLASLVAERTVTTASVLSISVTAQVSRPSSPQDLNELLYLEQQINSAEANLLP